MKKDTTTKTYRRDIAKNISATSNTLTDILTHSMNLRKEEITSDKYGNKAF